MEETKDRNSNDITVLAGEFIENLRMLKYSGSSTKSYSNSLDHFNHFIKARGRNSAVEVTAHDIADYRLNLVERGLKQNSLYIYLRVVRLFFKYLHDNEHVFVNPAAGMKMPGPDRRLPSVPTENEIIALLSLPDTGTPIGMRDRAILETLYSTAMRNGELVSMDVRDLDMAQSTIRIMGKGKQERIVPMGREAMNWVKRYLVEVRDGLMNANMNESALWLNQEGKRLSGQLLHIMIKRYVRSSDAISTHITPHSLRRACATHMLQHGASPFDIQLLLGHADLSHLRNYLRISIHDLKAMHEKTRLGE